MKNKHHLQGFCPLSNSPVTQATVKCIQPNFWSHELIVILQLSKQGKKLCKLTEVRLPVVKHKCRQTNIFSSKNSAAVKCPLQLRWLTYVKSTNYQDFTSPINLGYHLPLPPTVHTQQNMLFHR